MGLKDKIILLIGATGGIGSAIARELTKEGVRVILVSRSTKELDNLSRELGAEKAYTCNLLDRASIRNLGNNLRKNFEKVDALINAAGIGIYKSFEDASFDDWEVSFGLNVNANFLVTKEVFPLLKKSKKGIVVSLGSGMGKRGFSQRSLYCSSKFALRGWSLSMSKEYKNTNLRFSLLTLGSVLTGFGIGIEKKKERIKQGKNYLSPESVARKVVSIIENGGSEEEYSLYPRGYTKERKA